jgi:hypothetical protein
MSLMKYMKVSKISIQAVYESVAEKALSAGKTIKEYLHDEQNIKHISLVVYDLLPLTVKLGLRHEKFYNHFSGLFKKIRNNLFNYHESQVELVMEEIKVPVKPKVVRKKSVKPAVITATKRVVKAPVQTVKAKKSILPKKVVTK